MPFSPRRCTCRELDGQFSFHYPDHIGGKIKEENFMAFFNSAVGVLQTLVVALGAGLGIWGAINLLEGYGNDNRATRS